MSRNLRLLNALRAFEAAARLGSFTNAAAELGVTSAAVGQQVRGLEAHLGASLFERGLDGLTLTPEAVRGLPQIRRGFDLLGEGFEHLQPDPQNTGLSISVAPTFAVKWLVPRLHRFYEQHPAVEVTFDTAMRYVDVGKGEVDLAIRFGSGRYPGLQRNRLFAEHVIPLCAPQLRHQGLHTPADLGRFTLLHLQGETEDRSWPDWPRWGEMWRLDRDRVRRGPRFTQSAMALEAAVDGQGVALCGLSYSLDEILAGNLIAPFGTESISTTRFGYDCVYSPTAADRPLHLAFRKWIRREASESRKLISKFLDTNPETSSD